MNLVFQKRRLGNSISRAFGIMFGIFWIFMFIRGVNIKGYLLGGIMILSGITFAFGKEMTQIDFTRKYIRQYIQILFFKSGSTKPLPEINYILIRDFNLEVSYSTMTDDADFYEISIVTMNKKKIVLALYSGIAKTCHVVNQLKENKDLNFVDKTRNKITCL